MEEATLLYEGMLASSQLAFDARLFMVAYYALLAAMHCAVTLKDSAKLHQIEGIAHQHRQQLSLLVDKTSKHNEFSLYDSLIQMVKTYLFLSHRKT